MNALKVGDKAKVKMILNPRAKWLQGRVVTVSAVPSYHSEYQADVKTREGWVLAVNWSQLEAHRQ